MRKARIFLMLLAALFVLSANAFAATVSIPASTGDNGSVYDIPVNIDNATGVAGYQFTITYDAAVLNCTTALRGSLTAGFDSPSNTLTSGQVITLSIEPSLTELAGGSGSLALIRCTVVGAGGTSTTLHFVPDPATILSNGNGDAIAATYVDGSFTVNGGCVPSTEVCDGVDNDCDGQIDEGLTRPTSCGVGACAAAGIETCTAGVWGSNTCAPGTPTAEVCNSIDDDCNGTVDNGIASTPTTCGVGACAATGQRTCQGGNLVDSCTPGTPSAEVCTGSIDEDCDGLVDCQDTGNCGADPACIGAETNCFDQQDNNGNGLIDCADNACNGAFGPSTVCGSGTCAATGHLICQSGQVVDTCTPGAPVAEVCDGADNDCDTLIDEDLTRPTSCGTGACAGTGIETCAAGVWGGNTCVPDNPTAEVCDGLDNNCNGLTDDGLSCTGTRTVSLPNITAVEGVTVNISVDINDASGVAGYQMTVTYDASVLNCFGALRGSLTGGYDTPSNNIMPGQIVTLSIDPGLSGLGNVSGSLAILNCTVVGADATSTVLHFVPDPATILSNSNGDSIFATYMDGSLTVAGGCTPVAEVCDGTDNDCDGLVDEDLTRPTSCGVGACARTGIETCTNGVWGGNTCVAGTSAEEICDDIDNNCDGQIDEVTRPTTCGVGACSSTGQEFCSGFSPGIGWVDSCIPGKPQPEGPFGATCGDAVDNNCDGNIDAADPNCVAMTLDMSRWLGQWFTIKRAIIASAGTDASGLNVVESKTPGYAEIWKWDPKTEELYLDYYEYVPAEDKWSTTGLTFSLYAGNDEKFQFWYNLSDDTLVLTITGELEGWVENGMLRSARMKTSGSFQAELLESKMFNFVGAPSLTGDTVPLSEVPVPSDLILENYRAHLYL